MPAHTNLNISPHNKWNNLRSRFQFGLVNTFGSDRSEPGSDSAAEHMKTPTRLSGKND